LGVPSLPGSFLDVLSFFSKDQNGGTAGGSGNGNGNGNTIQMSEFTNQGQASGPSNESFNTALANNQTAGGSGASGSNGAGAKSATNTNSTDKAGKPISSGAKGKGKGKETPPVNPLNISGASRMYVPQQLMLRPTLTGIENDTSLLRLINLPDPVIPV
jgi:hypothetical protein